MAIEVAPIPLPSTADASKFNEFGREVKNVHPGELTEEQLKEIQDLLYKVGSYDSEYRMTIFTRCAVDSTVCFFFGT